MFKKFIPILIIFIFLSNTSIASTQDVENFVDKVADRIIKIVTNKNSSEKTKSSQILKMINDEFDVKWMSRFTLGRSYRKLSDSQQESYIDLYTQYLCNNYSPILMKYSDESYKISKVMKTGSKDYDVDVSILRKGGAPAIALRYHVKEVSPDSYKAVDMVVEGISTILSQRSEFSYIVQEKGIDGLLEDLRGGKVKKQHNID
jgi:phospholipid transport system substrate-binding protein